MASGDLTVTVQNNKVASVNNGIYYTGSDRKYQETQVIVTDKGGLP